MISEGTLEQIIRNELIIIKMFENNESLYPMIEKIFYSLFLLLNKHLLRNMKKKIIVKICVLFIYIQFYMKKYGLII